MLSKKDGRVKIFELKSNGGRHLIRFLASFSYGPNFEYIFAANLSKRSKELELISQSS